jgi:hypothetical protein
MMKGPSYSRKEDHSIGTFLRAFSDPEQPHDAMAYSKWIDWAERRDTGTTDITTESTQLE